VADGGASKAIVNFIVLGFLLVALLTVMTKFGYVRCSVVPGFCPVYYQIMGQPTILIMYEDNQDIVFATREVMQYGILTTTQEQAFEYELGENGTGNAVELQELIVRATGIFPAMVDVDDVISAGNLNDFNLLIVEGAKKIPTETLRAIAAYAESGGNLIWVGDAGTMLDDSKADTLCKVVRYDLQCAYFGKNMVSIEPVKTYCDTGVTPDRALEHIWEQINETACLWHDLLKYGMKNLTTDCDFANQIPYDFNMVVEYVFPEGLYDEQVTVGEDVTPYPLQPEMVGIEIPEPDPTFESITEAIPGFSWQHSYYPDVKRTEIEALNCLLDIKNIEDLNYTNPWIRGPQKRGDIPDSPQLFFFSDVIGSEYLGNTTIERVSILSYASSHQIVKGFQTEIDFREVFDKSVEAALVYPYTPPAEYSGYAVPQMKLINELAVIRPCVTAGPAQGCTYVDDKYLSYGTTFPAIYDTKYVGRVLYFAFGPEELESLNFIKNIIDYLFY
jgi:hypothetical protein